MSKSCQLLVGATVVVALLLQLRWGDGGINYLIGLVIVWAIAAIGYDLVFGLSGLLSFGHAAFFGGGAYVFGYLSARHQVPFTVALACGTLVGAALGGVFGKVALRASGLYLGLITLALGQLVNIIATVELQAYTGGVDGLSGVRRPEGPSWLDFSNDRVYIGLLLLVLCVVLAAVRVLRESPFGQVLRAARQNQVRAEQLGWNVNDHRLAAFVISGAVVGLAGGLMASLMAFVGPERIHWGTSGDLVIMTLLGGRDTLLGPLVGVTFMTLLREVASAHTEYWSGILGIIFILCTLFMPSGLMGLLASVTARLRARRANHEAAASAQLKTP